VNFIESLNLSTLDATEYFYDTDLCTEVEDVQDLTYDVDYSLQLIVELNEAQDFDQDGNVDAGLITETNAAQDLVAETEISVDVIVSVNTVQDLVQEYDVEIIPVTETNTLQDFTQDNEAVIVPISCADEIQEIFAEFELTLETIFEHDSAQAVQTGGVNDHDLVNIVSVNTAQALTVDSDSSIAFAQEFNLLSTLVFDDGQLPVGIQFLEAEVVKVFLSEVLVEV